MKKIKINVLRNPIMPSIPRLEMEDGFTMSVQAGSHSYSTPREMVGEYEELEVGFPSECEPLLEEYAEDSADLTETVYGYVPAEVILEVIEKHGGLVSKVIEEV
jgi:hypothetical protein